MDTTVYAAATGLKYRTQALNVTANNLSNMETPGFKRSEIFSEMFGEHVLMKVGKENKNDVGASSYGVSVSDIHTDFSQGTIKQTGKELDVAINGWGFFTVENENGLEMLSRAGGFSKDADGFLIDQAGNFVLGNQGRINLGDGEVIIYETGEIAVDENVIDTLRITVPVDDGVMTRIGEGYYTYNGAAEAFEGKIVHGSLEVSNSDLIEEMTDMIRHSRAFQSCGQIVKIADQINQKTVTELARVK